MQPTGLDRLCRRAADLQQQIDAAPDQETAQPLAEELHRLLDEVDNVRVIRPRRGEA